MKESYVCRPPEVEAHSHGGGTDIILRKNIAEVTDEEGVRWECEERQMRSENDVRVEDVLHSFPAFWAIAGGEKTPTQLQEEKISEMSECCHAAITAGIDIVLEDGKNHHFSLTVEDQTNINSMFGLLATGTTQVPYHADHEPCAYFTAEEFGKIVEAATAHKTFHVTYFNSLREYIRSLDDAESINAVYYGIGIPADHQSDVLKMILAQTA